MPHQADSKLLKILVKIAGKLKHLKDVITMSEPAADAVEKLKAAGINVHVMDELKANGAKEPAPATPAAPCRPEDPASPRAPDAAAGALQSPPGYLAAVLRVSPLPISREEHLVPFDDLVRRETERRNEAQKVSQSQ